MLTKTQGQRITLQSLFIGVMVVLACLGEASTACADVEANKVNLPVNLVRFGSQAFYKVYGRWPTDWQEVVATGLVQVSLSIPGQGTVDPDDTALDFPGDVRYLGSDSVSGQCRLAVQNAHTPGTRIIEIDAPQTYSQLFPAIDATCEELGSPAIYSHFLESESWLRLLAIVGIADNMCLVYYISNENQAPTSLSSLLDSGFMPINIGSINPVTGQAFSFTGGPNELKISIPSSGQSTGSAGIAVYDSDGHDLGIGMF
jgi:hypothetical protein